MKRKTHMSTFDLFKGQKCVCKEAFPLLNLSPKNHEYEAEQKGSVQFQHTDRKGKLPCP